MCVSRAADAAVLQVPDHEVAAVDAPLDEVADLDELVVAATGRTGRDQSMPSG